MWFTPPVEIPTRVLARMPEQFRRPERTEWADANRAGEPVDCFLEGPCYDAQGRLHVVDIPYGRIFRVEGDAWTLIAEYPGWPNGLKVQPDGVLLAADYRHGLVRIDPKTGTTSAVLQTVMSESFKGLNDLTLHDDELILFTDQGQTGLQDPTGRVWRLHKDGRLDRLISTGPSPNGLVLNAAQTHLYVAMTRSCEVWRFLLRADAVVARRNALLAFRPAHPARTGWRWTAPTVSISLTRATAASGSSTRTAYRCTASSPVPGG